MQHIMKLKIYILIAIINLFGINKVAGQENTLLLGVRDNVFAKIGYVHKNNWFIIAEQSLFISDIKNQVINGYTGYKSTWRNLSYKGCIYGATAYNKNYTAYGIIAEANCNTGKYFNFIAGIRPHYDSTYGYVTGYKGEACFKFHENITLKSEITNYPEYRFCIHRFKAGLIFKVFNLSVTPEISIPLKDYYENIRMLISFNYLLHL